MKHIIYENIRVKKAGTALQVSAPEGTPLHDVTFIDVSIEQADTSFVLKNAENLRFDNFQINGERVDGHLSWK